LNSSSSFTDRFDVQEQAASVPASPATHITPADQLLAQPHPAQELQRPAAAAPGVSDPPQFVLQK
jgi:hypothetical protein